MRKHSQHRRYFKWIPLLLYIALGGGVSILLSGCDQRKLEASLSNQPLIHKDCALDNTVVATHCDEVAFNETSVVFSEHYFAPQHEEIGTLSLLSRKYVSIELAVRDISKYQFDNNQVIEVVFSVALVPDQEFADFIQLMDASYHPIEGDWQILDNYMGVAFHGNLPESELILSVDVGLMGINGSTLAQKETYQLKPSSQTTHYLKQAL